MTKRFLRSSVATIVLMALGIALIAFGSVRGARAALRVQSRTYLAEMDLNHIYTELYEDGKAVSDNGTILADLTALREKGKFVVGQTYDKKLAVHNPSNVEEYVRVNVYHYWTDAEGKRVDLNTDYIELGYGSSWTVEDETNERTILFYPSILAAGEVSDPFLESITINSETQKLMNDDGSYVYEGCEFHVEVVVDAVQTHNASDAMTGVWGEAY